jgi:membrane-bound lytic murein transglycosylase F
MSALIRQTRYLLAPLAIVAVVASMVAMRPLPSTLERVQTRGELVVATRVSPTTWYKDQHGDTGLDYELARGFAEQLGVELKLVRADSIEDIYELVDSGEVDMAAAGLAITALRSDDFRFSAPYQQVNDVLVMRQGEKAPGSLHDLADRRIAVLAGSGQEQHLRQLRVNSFLVDFESIDGSNAERLLTLVDEGYFDLALVDSNSWAVNRSLFPELRRSLDLGEQQIGWAFSDDDTSLVLEADRFLTRKKADGTLAQLESRFFGHINQFNLYAARSFLRHLDSRLPQYSEAFRQAAEEYGFDWRLLAAMGYQESLWNPAAVSPTGVRGLMMLTNRTAKEMGVADRTDPLESIRAGAAYLRKLYDRIPARIPEPDRTWMAVAAYNVGMGHLEDARILTQQQGANPDSWQDVKTRLPLLRHANYYRSTRHGYARGGMQSVIYVRHIRRYYDLLVWANQSERHGQLVALASN